MENNNAEKIYQILQKFHKINIQKKSIGELPRSELMMLKKIKMNSSGTEGITISALSDMMMISKSAVSQAINTLEDKDYVKRTTTRNDRRLVYVQLTEKGQQCLDKELQAFFLGLNRIFTEMGDADAEELLRLLSKLYSIVSEFNVMDARQNDQANEEAVLD